MHRQSQSITVQKPANKTFIIPTTLLYGIMFLVCMLVYLCAEYVKIPTAVDKNSKTDR